MAEEITALKNEGEEELITQTELMQKNIGTELVVKAIGGDEDAFEELYMLSYRYVFAVARHYLKKDEDIYDAIQDTYTRVYKNLSKLNEPEAFAYWLRKIAENCSKTVRDRKTVDGDIELFEAEFVSGEDELGRKDVELDITEVLSELQPDQAELLTRVYYDKLTVAEIARMQGKPKSTVYGQFKAANKKLKELLKIRGIDKPVYGGDAVAMITTMFRNAIGTDLLSATVAHEILENVRGKDSRGGAVITAVAKKERNAAVLRFAGVMIASALFFALLIFGGYMIVSRLTDSGEVAAGGNDMNFWGPLFGQNSSSDSPSEPNFWDKLFGNNSSSEEASSDDPSSSSGTSSEPSNHTSSDESSSTEGSASSGSSSEKAPSGSTISTTSQSGNNLTFESDCLPEQYNQIGRTVDNGYMASQGDWIYTAIGHITNFNNNDGLWKAKRDGSSRVKLSNDSASNINVVGDNIYFLAQNGKITQIRTDGKNKKTLSDLYALELTVVGNTAYFSSYGKKGYGSINKYYKMNLTTLETEVIIDNLSDKMVSWVSPDKVFVVDTKKYTISRFYPETKTTELWYENISTGGVVTGGYYVADKIYDLQLRRTPITYVADNEEAVICGAYYYKSSEGDKLYLDFLYYDKFGSAPMETRRGVLKLSDMSFKPCGVSFDSELYINGYSYSNIHDGYIYVHNEEGYFMRKEIEGDGFLMYK